MAKYDNIDYEVYKISKKFSFFMDNPCILVIEPYGIFFLFYWLFWILQLNYVHSETIHMKIQHCLNTCGI